MKTKDHPYLYRKSLTEAKRYNEVEQWQESFRQNVACKEAIEEAIRRDFDGFNLKPDCAKSVIEDFGFLRTAWVLTTTLQQKYYDGRFSRDNKAWAEEVYIPKSDRNHEFVVESHPAVLDGFINEYRNEFAQLHLFGPKACESLSGQDLKGKVLVLSTGTLREACWSQENQLWLATGGFGCSPTASGRAVYATCLGDGEQTRWDRSDFTGILPKENLPEWAVKKLAEIRQEDGHSAAPTMTMDTM